MYSSYVKSYTSALAHINECISRNDRFAEFLKVTIVQQERLVCKESQRPSCINHKNDLDGTKIDHSPKARMQEPGFPGILDASRPKNPTLSHASGEPPPAHTS